MDAEQKKRLLKAAGFLAALGAAFLLVVLVLRPPCIILRVTGFYCAGCGGQRMIWALLRGDIPGAFRHNPLLFVLLPLTAAWLLWEAARYVKGKPPLCQGWQFLGACLVLLIAAIAFTVLRNLPCVVWLGP